MRLHPIDKNVVHDATASITHHRVLRLQHGKFCRIVRRHALQKKEGPITTHHNTPHMTHIEQARRGAYGRVLSDNTGVLDRHLPAGEIHEPPPGLAMSLKQWRSLHECSFLRKERVLAHLGLGGGIVHFSASDYRKSSSST